MQPLIEASELQQLAAGTYILIDARGFGNSRERYEQGHLEDALYVDLENLAAHTDNPAIGGRHPLPGTKDFALLLGNLGIAPQSHVIVYDDKAGANPAARFWWMLKAIGHEKVQVLNGGLQAAIDTGSTLSTAIPNQPKPNEYPIPACFQGTATIDEVAQAAQNSDNIVIDVREAPRYLGQTEPLDLVAGHIPANDLRANYHQTLGNIKPEQVIVHCGSGVTACHTLLALAQAGLSGARLYVGSWSEWSRRDLPVATDSKQLQ
jgi:thiosulfate/3-mercaptopyruvate sulfurtransferase